METIEGRRINIEFIAASTVIVDLTRDIAELAGEIDVERKNWNLGNS